MNTDTGLQLAVAAANELNDELTVVLGALENVGGDAELGVVAARAAWRCALVTNRLLAFSVANGGTLGADGTEVLFRRWHATLGTKAA